jgi:hypothetical protein
VNREIADVPTARGDGTVTVTARSFETLAANYPLPFRAPFSRAKGDHFEYWWHLIQFAFDLPDPNSFPALPALAIDNQRTIVDRYVVAADDLSESAFLAHPTMLNVKVGGSGFGEQITRAFPPNENIRGFSVLLRQFHGPAEPASFNNVQRILRRANDLADDMHRQTRFQSLSAWGRAAGRLRAFQVKVLVGRRLYREGRFGPGPFPGEELSPEQLISLYNYGEDIHWGRQRDDLSALGVDTFAAAWQRMNFFEGTAALAHLYLGFAQLVRAATAGVSSPA